MECQNIIKNLKINKEKAVGDIVIIVEGESLEFKLLKHIFTSIFDYNYVALKRGKIVKDKLENKETNSTVFIMNTSNSNIKSLLYDENYKEELYHLLCREYGRSLKSTPIYILWDRDNLSNSLKDTYLAMKTFGSALDNGYEMNGLLLLSYPCVECYELSNFDKQLWRKTFATSKEVKSTVKASISGIDKITEKTLLLAIANMHQTMKMYEISEYDPSFFRTVNEKILKKQSEHYDDEGTFNALSLISIMLVDLGIITLA